MKYISFLIAMGIVVFSTFAAEAREEQIEKEQADKATARQPDTGTLDSFTVLVRAIGNDNYAGFVAPLDDDMKAALTKPLFESVVALYASRLQKGYESVYLGNLMKKGYKVHLWKLDFNDNEDDVLVEMSRKNNKVSGFFLR